MSGQAPVTEDEYLAIAERIEQAMAIEPFRPRMIDVVQLLVGWREQYAEAARLREAGQLLAAESLKVDITNKAKLDLLRTALKMVASAPDGEDPRWIAKSALKAERDRVASPRGRSDDHS